MVSKISTRVLQDLETEEVIHVLTPQVRRHSQPFTMVFCDALLDLLCTEGRRHEGDGGMTLVHLRCSCTYWRAPGTRTSWNGSSSPSRMTSVMTGAR